MEEQIEGGQSGLNDQPEHNSSAGRWPESFDPQFLMIRAKSALTEPLVLLEKVKGESASPQGIYISYLMPLMAIPAICSFVGFTFIGQNLPFIGTYRWPFFSGLVHSVLNFCGMLIVVAITALIAEKLAPKFKAQTDFISTLKLFAIVWTPACLGGIFSLIPALGFIGLFFGIYSLYLFFKGIPVTVSVAEDSKLAYSLATFALTIVAGAVLMFAVNAISPSVHPEIRNINLPGGRSVDMNEISKGMENLQKMFPQSTEGR
jgi:hypothetical protein